MITCGTGSDVSVAVGREGERAEGHSGCVYLLGRCGGFRCLPPGGREGPVAGSSRSGLGRWVAIMH